MSAGDSINVVGDFTKTIVVPRQIEGTAGNDQNLIADEDNYTVYAYAGNDSVWASGNKVYVDASYGNDTVIAVGSSATIDGGAGNDQISLGSDASGASIIAGAGNDTIFSNDLGGHVYKFGNNEGTNYILNFRDGDEIIVDADLDSVATSTAITFNGFTLTIGNTQVYLKGELKAGGDSNTLADYEVLEGGTTVNITTTKDNVTTTTAYEVEKLIVGDGAANVIRNELSYAHNPDGYRINALSGNDTIYNSGSNVSIEAGNGNDIIFSTGNNITYIYSGDETSNDKIFNFNPTQDVIYIENSDCSLTHSIDGNNNAHILIYQNETQKANICLEGISSGTVRYKIADNPEQIYTIT